MPEITETPFVFTPLHAEIDPYLRDRFADYTAEMEYTGPTYSPALREQCAVSAANIRRLIEQATACWRQYHDAPTIRTMRRVVARQMKAYQSDFYLHDLAQLGNSPADRPFIWMVRPTGTWLVWQDDDRPEPRLILDEARRGEQHLFYRGSVATRLVKVADPETVRLG